MAHDTGRAQEHLASATLCVVRRFRRGRDLGVVPGGVIRRGFRIDVDAHVRVLEAAEFGAFAAVPPGFRRAQLQRGHVSRQQILLALQGRHPEAVDHIARGELQRDRPSHRDHQFVGRAHAPRWVGIHIFDVPPPLVRRDAHVQRVRRHRRERATVPEIADPEADENERGRYHRGADGPYGIRRCCRFDAGGVTRRPRPPPQ
jgi:hypothetical protein